jgi:hypothetical protein
MSTMQDAVRAQLEGFMTDLFKQDARVLDRAGITKQRRSYLKSEERSKKVTKLPPTDAVLVALILLRKPIVVEGVSLNGTRAPRYTIVALQHPKAQSVATPTKPVQMSLLAGLDFPPESEATIERAQRKGPNRVELLLNVRLPGKAS